jgi:hypothetical protein
MKMDYTVILDVSDYPSCRFFWTVAMKTKNFFIFYLFIVTESVNNLRSSGNYMYHLLSH